MGRLTHTPQGYNGEINTHTTDTMGRLTHTRDTMGRLSHTRNTMGRLTHAHHGYNGGD